MGRSELPVHPLINERFSPRAFTDRDISDDELQLMLEAARLAPSSLNEQPWRFLVVRKGSEDHAGMLSAMNASNRRWADKAPVLILSLARTRLERNGIENPHAWYDLGLAVMQLTIQAAAIGIGVRQLAGFDPEKARETFDIPAEFDVVTMLVLGFPGDPDRLPADLRDRELRRSARRSLTDLVLHGRTDRES